MLNDIDKHAPFDHIVCAGDLCLEGSDSDRCLELLQTREIECVYGNTDEYISNPSATPDEQHARVWDDIQRKAEKVRSQIGDVGIAYSVPVHSIIGLVELPVAAR